MPQSISRISYIRLLSDIIAIVCVFAFSSFISKPYFEKSDILLLLFLVIGWYFSTKVSNTYDDFRTERYVGELLLIFQNVLIQSVIAGQVLFILNRHEYTRRFIFAYILILLIVLIVKNYIIKKILLYYRQKGGNIKNVVFVGYDIMRLPLI